MHFEETHLATATGFVFYNGLEYFLVTARHNVTGRNHQNGDCLAAHGGVPDRVTVFFNKKGNIGEYVERSIDLYKDGNKAWREHPILKESADVVAIPIDVSSDVDLFPYQISSSYPNMSCSITDRCSVIGFPFATSAGGLFPIWVSGFVSSEPAVDFGGNPCILLDCRTRTGQSGSPVILYSRSGFTPEDGGQVFGTGEFARPIGVYVGRMNPESDIGIVWKWSVIEQLCRREFSYRISVENYQFR